MDMSDHRVSRVGEDAAEGDTGDHGPEERTAREGDGVAAASDEERARGRDSRTPTGRPAPPPREGEEPELEGELTAEEFVDES